MEKKTTTAAVELAASHSDRARVSMDMEAVGVSQSNRRVQEGEGDDGTSPQQHANMVGGMAPKVLVDIATELFGDEKREEEEEEEKQAKVSETLLVEVAGLATTTTEEEEEEEAKALDTSPVETKIFREHTRCFGLFFRTFRTERIFLDGYARLQKNVVYLGFFLFIFFLGIVLVLIDSVAYGYIIENCPPSFEYKCTLWGDRSTLEMIDLFYTDDVRAWWFASAVTLVFIGCASNFIIHRSKKIKEKSWAMLCVFAVYFLIFIITLLKVYTVTEYKIFWPRYISIGLSFLLMAPVIFLSGLPSFTPSFILCLLVILFYIIGYPVSLRALEADPADEFEYERNSSLMRTTWNQYLYFMFVVSVLYMIGSFQFETGSRKQFLQRVLMAGQQEQIIRQKSKNGELQKKLLENMLPSFVVDQLRQQNFTVKSWDQLQAISHRHLGVSIMFAELEGFTAFSSQVDPPQVLAYLNELFLEFDSLCASFDVYKVETVGDQYVAAVGVVTGQINKTKASEATPRCDFSLQQYRAVLGLREASVANTTQMIGYARSIIERSRRVGVPEEAKTIPMVRVGIHTGACMSGIVGTKNFRFCLFGDTMNTAARMEQHGLPECIHVTQDVVELVPDVCWEKQKLVDVKGKGRMQTYLLRMSIAGNASIEEDCSVESVSYDGHYHSSYSNPSFDEEQHMLEKKIALVRLNSKHRKPFVGSIEYFAENMLAQDKKRFREHTKWFGLMFKKPKIELAFLDSQARLHEKMVYIGYALWVLCCVSNLLYGYMKRLWEYHTCSDVNLNFYCIKFLGQWVYEEASHPPKKDILSIVFGSSASSSGPSAAVCLAITVLSILVHWLIHRSKRVTQKAWALVNVWVGFLAIQVTILVAAIWFARSSDRVYYTWPETILFLTLAQGTIFAFFSGAPLALNVLWWLTFFALGLGLGVPVILSERKQISAEQLYTPNRAIEMSIYSFNTLLWYSLCLLLGICIRDITQRMMFLQRILLIRQKNLILRARSRNDRMQRRLLENILPSDLLGKLKYAQQGRCLSRTFSRLQSMSRKHTGMCMLFADLVGFTSFSAQVDPFEVMVFLNDLFTKFDGMCDEYNVYKVETIGDCYVASVGVVTGEMVSEQVPISRCNSESAQALEQMEEDSENPLRSIASKNNSMAVTAASMNSRDLVGFAKAMIRISRQVMKPGVKTPAILRVGMHTGSCISGVVGTKIPKFSLFGRTCVIASTMEKTGVPDCIHASEDLATLVSEEDWQKSVWKTRVKGDEHPGDADGMLTTYVLHVDDN